MAIFDSGYAKLTDRLSVVKPLHFMLLALLIVWMLRITKGYQYIDLQELAILHTNPLSIIRPSRQFLYGSILSVWLGYAFGVQSLSAICSYYTILTVLSCLTVLLSFYFRYPQKTIQILLLFMLTPLSFSLFSWTGKSDPLLIMGYVLVFFSRRPVVVLLGVLVMVLSHREQGLIVLAAHRLLWPSASRESDLAVIGGVVIALVLHATYQYFLPVVPRSRISVVEESGLLAARENLALRSIPMEIFSIFGLFWLFIWHSILRQQKATKIRLLVVVCVACMVPFVTFDFTRVGVICALPAYFLVVNDFLECSDLRSSTWWGMDKISIIPLVILAITTATDCRNGGVCVQHF